MNNLTWVIYLIEVIPNISCLIMFMGYFGLICIFIFAFVRFAILSEKTSDFEKEYNPNLYKASKKEMKNLPKSVLKLIVPFICVLFFTTVIPNKETLYLMAGSEFGEMAVTSEEGQEIINDIHEILKIQLNKMKE